MVAASISNNPIVVMAPIDRMHAIIPRETSYPIYEFNYVEILPPIATENSQKYLLPSQSTASIIFSMNQSTALYRLQKIDTEIDTTHNRLQEIETLLSHNHELQQARQDHQELEAALNKTQSDLQRIEATVKAQKIKIEQTESALYGGKIRNPKELQDLQQELAALNRYLDILESQELEIMLVAEEGEQLVKESADILQDISLKTMETHESLKGESDQLTIKLQRLATERIVATNPIQPSDMELYEQLRKQRKGIAVTLISGKACAACGATLTPAAIQAAQSPSKLTRCPSCNRILYSG